MDAQWLDDFHHALRTAITPERGGYYGDYAGVASLAKALEDRYVYDGLHSAHWRRRRGQPAHDVPTSRFVAFAQNHDQVGNRARGERLHELTSFPQRKLAAATLLLSPFVPLLFMGDEYGEANPFLYFVSHQSPELVEAVRKGRREEFASFVWEGDIPDPAVEETFARCRLDLARRDQPEHRELHALYRDLLRLRRELPVLRAGATEPAVAHDAEAEWLVIGWPHPETPLLAVLNFAAERREVPLGAVVAGTWRRVLSTDEPAYGGDDAAPAVVDVATPAQAVVVAPAHSATLYRLDD
jgi:maltooligosyltrehalose trehalohydrolase